MKCLRSYTLTEEHYIYHPMAGQAWEDSTSSGLHFARTAPGTNPRTLATQLIPTMMKPDLSLVPTAGKRIFLQYATLKRVRTYSTSIYTNLHGQILYPTSRARF